MSMIFSDSKVMQVKFFTGHDEEAGEWTMTDRQLSEEFKMEGLTMFLVGSWFSLIYILAKRILKTNDSSFTKCARRRSCGMILMTMFSMLLLGHVKHEMF